ncbi:MAG: hypothetical protein KatS3mg095_0204 [Candidatus Parcubacteria bacterium]|nr:MAG: hypothetical protein KatS3mg095_0204 [Candidatus Parcubacteria bacterium]
MGEKEKILLIIYYLIVILFLWLVTNPDIWNVIIKTIFKKF